MNKVAKMFASASVIVAMSTTMASAATISNTGQNSTNNVTTNQNQNRVCVNNNLITVSNSNSQSATSGSANSSGNTNGGSATSGNSSNSNSSSTSVNVVNSGANGSCPAGYTPVPSDSAVVPTAKAGKPVTLSASDKVGGKGAALPETGASDTIKAAAFAVAGVATVAAISQVGFGAIRRNQ